MHDYALYKVRQNDLSDLKLPREDVSCGKRVAGMSLGGIRRDILHTIMV